MHIQPRDKSLSLNPYRQTLSQGIPRKLFPKAILTTQGIFRKLFPKSMILNEIWNFVNSGNDPGEFPETFSRYWKKFPENPLSHAPKLQNLEKVWKKVSGSSLGSLPEFTKFQISFKIIDFGKIFRHAPKSSPLIFSKMMTSSFVIAEFQCWNRWLFLTSNDPVQKS